MLHESPSATEAIGLASWPQLCKGVLGAKCSAEADGDFDVVTWELSPEI